MFDPRKSFAPALGVAAALSGQTTFAQESATPSGSLLEEVVVTAQRREEKIQDVPIAISAFSEAQLEQFNVTQALGISKLIPNLLAFNNTGLGTANGYYLRGIGNTESIPTFDPPVGTYVDDIFISRQNANNFGLFDMDRIEVLRGPQGTLFGRNTTGGAVNLIMKKPAKEFGGYAEAGFGQFNQVTGRGSIDVPVSDTVLTKLSAYYIKDDGYIDAAHVGKLDADGAICAVKYAIVRDNPKVDPFLEDMLSVVNKDIVISGIGERPAIDHLTQFGLGCFTSGSVCVGPASSTARR